MKAYNYQSRFVIPLDGEWVVVQYGGDYEWYLTKYDIKYQHNIMANNSFSMDVNELNLKDKHSIIELILIWRRTD